MAMKVQAGKMVRANSVKAGRDKALHALMDELGRSRDRIQVASQKLPNFEMPNENWNQHVANMRRLHEAIGEVYQYAAQMLHLQ